MFTRIIIGFFVTALGFVMVWRTQWFMEILGAIPWAEKVLGGGGTRMFYKLLGIAVIVIGLLTITDLFNLVVGGIFSSIFP